MEIRKLNTPWTVAAVLLYIIAISIPSTLTFTGLQGRAGLRAHWSHWSGWSSCSRTCGGGVAEQTRTCLRRRRGRAKSMHTSNHCVGLYKRYKMCNRKDCPDGSRPFREEQCDMYNTMPLMDRLYTWEALIKENKPCELHCRAQGQTFFAKLADKVIDGTPCRNNSDIDVCVDGMCKRVGCDGVLGSGLVLDKCGVCGGSNTDCEITREHFDKNDLTVGYHIIATVPEGAMYINMTELRRSRNYLAVESADGKPYINGAWHIDYPGNFTVAGTVFQYKRSTRTDEGEQILAMGPTNEVVHLMMIYQQANPGIYYEYTIPLHKPSDVRGVGGDLVNEQDYDYSSYSDYERVPLPGSSNPKSPSVGTYPYKYPPYGQGNPHSGGHVPIYAVDPSNPVGGRYPYDNPGYQPHSRPPADTPYDPRQQGGSSLGGQYPPRVMEPPRQSNPAQYPNRGSNDALKQGVVGTFDAPGESSSSSEPVDETEESNQMMYYWMETEMTECSRSCAGGIQQSMSHCVELTQAARVDDSMCVLDWKPATKTMACNTQPCPPTWTIGEWTECSATCGQSRRIRQVLCKEQRTISVITTVPFENCNQTTRPTSMETCDVPSCAAWQVGEWGECSADCGIGEKQRRVYCEANGAEVLERNCAGQEKPDASQECDMGSCVPEWLFSSYSDTCSVGCGTGYKTRNVICSTAGVAGAVSQENCEGMKKPKATKVCNRGSCGAKWVMSEWSQCTSECGPGTQTRTVVCLSSRNYPRIVSDSECRGEKPAENQECLVRECGSMWYTSDYSQCSRSCGGGTMTRTVKCLNEAFEPSTDCPEVDKPSSVENCNPHECVDNAPPTNCRDKFSYCNKVARSRLCSYSYYSRLCCFSCYNQVHNT